MTIHSDPPGARVFVDGKDRGFTPASFDFGYYATNEIKLVKPGYETLKVLQKVPPPWYQRVPFDFFSDNLSPFPVTNRREFRYQMKQSQPVSQLELLDRADQLRSEVQIGP